MHSHDPIKPLPLSENKNIGFSCVLHCSILLFAHEMHLHEMHARSAYACACCEGGKIREKKIGRSEKEKFI